MATRLYFPLDEAAAVSPAIQGTYAHTNTVRRRLLTTPDSSTLTTTAYTPDAADHSVAGAAHHRQYVSDQISARTVDGTWKLQIQGSEPNANCNQSLNVMIFVCDSAGTTIKETLYAQAVAGNEFNTSLRNLTGSGTISSATLEDNDRIVVQIGSSGTPGSGGGVQGHNTSIRWGCSASSGDLPENETETGTTFRGWVEFSANLFTTPYSADLTAASFDFTANAITRLNDYIAQATAATFNFTAQSLTRLNDWIGNLTAPVFTFTPLEMTWDIATGFVVELTTATFAMTAQAVNRFNDYIIGLSTATFSVTAQAMSWFQDTLLSLTPPAFNFVPRVLQWSDGTQQYLSCFYKPIIKKYRKMWRLLNGPGSHYQG